MIKVYRQDKNIPLFCEKNLAFHSTINPYTRNVNEKEKDRRKRNREYDMTEERKKYRTDNADMIRETGKKYRTEKADAIRETKKKYRTK